MKREHVLSWDEYFMGLAHLSAMRSKDPSTQVGAVIVDAEHKVVGIGYNGLPIGCSDDEFPWDRNRACHLWKTRRKAECWKPNMRLLCMLN